MGGISATSDDGQTVEVRDVEVTPRGGAAPSGLEVLGLNTTAEEQRQRIMNPLNEPELEVRAREGAEFFHQGELRRGGDTFTMTVTQARAASAMVDAVLPDGRLAAIPNEQQRLTDAPRANVAGMARHERIGEYEKEREALVARLAAVDERLTFERDALANEQRAAGPQHDDRTKTTSVPPRPSETGTTNTPAPPKGPVATPPGTNTPGALIPPGTTTKA